MEGLESFFTVSQQLKLFCMSCLFGIPIGIVFDIFRSLRIIFPHGKVITALEDILFFIFYGIFLMSFTAAAARSEFRFYFCIGNLIGFIIYFFTIGNTITSLLKVIISALKKGLYFVFKPINDKIVVLIKKSGSFFVENLQKLKMKGKKL